MTEKVSEIPVKCFFCDSILKRNEKKEFKSGDQIRCQECGEHNDYDALMEVAVEEAKILGVQYAKEEMAKILKNVFKK